MLNAVSRILGMLMIGASDMHVALVQFGTHAHVKWRLNRYTDVASLQNAVSRIVYLGPHEKTNLAEAFEMTRTQVFGQAGDRPHSENVVILITDMIPTERTHETIPQADALKAQGVYLVPVGITREVDMDQLRRIATDPNSVVKVEEFHLLEAKLSRLIQTYCQGLPVIRVDPVRDPGR